MNKLLVILGPTATGKTALALALAKKFNGSLVSADSRQVYRQLNIGTGKDLPAAAVYRSDAMKDDKNKIGCYRLDDIDIWGYDLVDPGNVFSVALYRKIATAVVKNIWERDKLPILVGGSGLYIKALTESLPAMAIPFRPNWRKKIKNLTTDELFEKLAEMDPVRAGNMNCSDRANPRRLVRAIEIAFWKIDHPGNPVKVKPLDNIRFRAKFIGLKAPGEYLNERIGLRTEEMLRQGIIDEIENLLKKGINWRSQSMQSIGYKEWRNYFDHPALRGPETVKKICREWVSHQIAYARRQMIWFKKQKNISWYDITRPDFAVKIEKEIEKWYDRGNR